MQNSNQICKTEEDLFMASFEWLFCPSDCCEVIKIDTQGPSNETQSIRLGVYHREGEFSGKPAYVHSQRTERLFYISGRARGLWMVGPEIGRFSGGLANRGDTQCPEDILRPWKYADISGWKTDHKLTIECHQIENGKAILSFFINIGRFFK